MSGGCRVLTLPAYSRLSSLGINTGSPSCRSSLWMVQERAAGEDSSAGSPVPGRPPFPPQQLPLSSSVLLTQGGALLYT